MNQNHIGLFRGVRCLALLIAVFNVGHSKPPKTPSESGTEVRAVVFYDFTGRAPTSTTIINSGNNAWKALYDLAKQTKGRGDVNPKGEDLWATSLSSNELSDLQEKVTAKNLLPKSENTDDASKRVISKKGDKIAIFTVLRKDHYEGIHIEAKEDSRETILRQELDILGGTGKSNTLMFRAKEEPGERPYIFVYQEYDLTKTRATLVLSASIEKDNPAKGDAKDAHVGEIGGGKAENSTFLTGPRETLFLGASVSQKDVKFKDGSVTPKEKPKDLKVGLYWVPFGDVLSDYDYDAGPTRFLGNMLVLHISGEFSKTPFSSGAFGIGIKYPKVHRGDLKFLSGLSVTYGVMWTEAERTAGTTKERFHQRDWTWMVGYDLLQVKGWFTK